MPEFKVYRRKSKGNMEPGVSENLLAPETPAKPPPLRPHQVHGERRCTVATSSTLVYGCEKSDTTPRFGIDLNESIHDDPALSSQASVNSDGKKGARLDIDDNKKVHRVECSPPIDTLAILTPLRKHCGSKRQNNVINMNKSSVANFSTKSRSSLAHRRRIFQANCCLTYSKKIGPNVPEWCKFKRSSIRRKLNLFSFSYPVGHIRRKRRSGMPDQMHCNRQKRNRESKENETAKHFLIFPKKGSQITNKRLEERHEASLVCTKTGFSFGQSPELMQIIVKPGLQEVFDEESISLKTVKVATMNKLIRQLQSLKITDKSLVSYKTRKRIRDKAKPQMEVDLDLKFERMWNQLIQIDGSDEEKEDKEREIEKEQWMEKEKETFRGRIELFTSRLRNILGDRRFKPWKGSVVDSVVGVFLTQNVSDILSSTAYMSLAAKFPVRSDPQEPATISSPKLIGSSMDSIGITHGNRYFVTEPEHESDINHVIQNLSINKHSKGLRLLHEVGLKQNDAMRSVYDAIDVNKKCQNGEQFEEHVASMASDEVKKNTLGKKKKVQKKVGKDIILRKRDWESLRRIYARPRSSDQMDSVDWEAVRQAKLGVIANIIELRGQQNILEGRIKEFLNRVVEMHKSIDLEWLRYAPPDDVKDYLLEFTGLGLKSVECLRLLTLQHVAFPVDTNVGRIAVRLGWVPLKPLPGDLHFHMIEQFPIMDSIQKYLWPRLSMLDQRTLYELHYHMITFGKVFCTKRKPNCHGCPMKGECKHYASANARANFFLTGTSEKCAVKSLIPSMSTRNSDVFRNNDVVANSMLANILNFNKTIESGSNIRTCEPIVEEPKSPKQIPDIEDLCKEICMPSDDEEIPTIKLNNEDFNVNEQNNPHNNSSRDLVLLSMKAASITPPKLKNINSLRTEHQVYVLPDDHELLRGLYKREWNDDLRYLFAIWAPGEVADSYEPPTKLCKSQGSKLCKHLRCFACQSIREERADIVRGTILIPIRTALKGCFPLNGTYFQVNEVFADHESSYDPIIARREWLWKLPKVTVYIGTSATAMFRGLPEIDIQRNFVEGYICTRGIDRKTGAPTPLAERFHCSPSKIERKNRKKPTEPLALPQPHSCIA